MASAVQRVSATPIRVVLVEDRMVDAELEVRELKRAGLRVEYRVADTEPAFRQTLGEYCPDVILSDFSMPEFDGMFALRIARELCPDTPFIFVSGTIGEEYAIRALKNGATDYVLKTNLVRLPPTVERALQDARKLATKREMEEALKASEERYRMMFEAAAVGILHASLDGHIQMANPKFCEMMGYVRDEIAQLGIQDLAYSQDLIQSVEARSQLLSGAGAPYERELRMIRKDGSRLWTNVTTSLVRTANGEPLHFISVLNDISERKAQQEKIERLSRVQTVLSSINALIVRVTNRDELFKEVCRIAVDAGKFSLAWIGVVDREKQVVSVTTWQGHSAGYIERMPLALLAEQQADRGMAGKVATDSQTMVANDIASDPNLVIKQAALERGFRSLIMLPLLVDSEAVAVLALYSDKPGFFDDEEVRLLNELAGNISFALDHLEKASRLDYLAFYDSVTGLANRTLFHERLKQSLVIAAQERREIALIILDIERFKTINDTLGRQAGDALLRQIADRMAGHASHVTGLARIEADHFAIMIPDVKNANDLARLAEQRLEEVFVTPYRIGETELRVAAKLGVAVFPGDGADVDTLFRNAEAALKKAKTGGERYLFYTQAMNERVAEKLSLENKLRQAIERNEFVLHYQPKVDLDERRVIEVEALIRWQSPELGLVPPMKFISLLEETGMILPVGAWALKQASLDHRGWVEQGLTAPRVAVNVSAIQLRQRDFVSIVEQAIIEGVAPTGIDLEITESLIMEDIQSNIEKLKSIRGLGVNIAIDDFGTGYSSLAYLAKLPVQTLKIDRSFIIRMLKEPDTMILVQTMISLAHSLKLNVVAEGVDEEEQAKILKLLRCDKFQGYLFSKPLPLDQLTALLERKVKD